jgi:hypothetical protein
MKLDPARCPARSKQRHAQCGNVLGYKTDHVGMGPCKYHGGMTWNPHSHKVEVEKFYAVEAARIFREKVDIDPHLQLRRALERCAQMVAHLERAVSDGSLEQTVRTPGGGSHQDVSVDARLLGEWHDRQAKIVDIALKAGFKEREIRLAEADGIAMTEVFIAAMAELGVDKVEASRILAAKIRELNSGVIDV